MDQAPSESQNPNDQVLNTPVSEEQVAVAAPKIKSKHVISKKVLLIPVFIIIVAIVALIAKNLPNTQQVPDSSNSIVWWGEDLDPALIEPLIEKYKSDHPGIEIKYEKMDKQDYRERLSNALARGAGPDIMTIHNSWIPMFKGELDIAPTSVFNVEDFSKVFFPVAVSDLSSGKGLYGIPLEYDGLGMYVNLDILARYKQDVPLIWDDFIKVAKTMTARDATKNISQSGTSLGNYTNVDHWPEILALLMIQDGVRMSNLNDPLVLNALSFYQKFGSGNDASWDTTLPYSTLAFANNKVAIYFAPSYRSVDIKLENPNLNYKIYPVPQIASDPVIKRSNTSYATYWVQSVWKRSRAKGISWDFLKFLSEKDTLKMMHKIASEKGIFVPAYPRSDMADEAKAESLTYGIWSQAPIAKSWYLASNTNDGATGINSQFVSIFSKNIGSRGKVKDDVFFASLNGQVNQLLSKYKISSQ